MGQNASDSVTGGLRFMRSNADFLAHQAVEQGGFTDIGTSDNGNQACAKRSARHAMR
jgi:hypothetical protein